MNSLSLQQAAFSPTPTGLEIHELILLAASQGMEEALYWHCQSVFGRRPLDLMDCEARAITNQFLPVILELALQKKEGRTLQ